MHTVYVPADRITPGLSAAWGTAARRALAEHPPVPFDADLLPRVHAKLDTEPIEDLRVDFEDGYGVRPDGEEDAAVDRAVAALAADAHAARGPAVQEPRAAHVGPGSVEGED